MGTWAKKMVDVIDDGTHTQPRADLMTKIPQSKQVGVCWSKHVGLSPE